MLWVVQQRLDALFQFSFGPRFGKSIARSPMFDSSLVPVRISKQIDGRPIAMASDKAFGNPSKLEGRTKIDASVK